MGQVSYSKILFFICLVILGHESILPTTILSQSNEELKDGVVKIFVRRQDDSVDTGAGIIVAADSQKIYILTALHVVSRGDEDDLERTKMVVQFYSFRRNLVRGKLFSSIDEDLDLAVVTVDAQSVFGFNIAPKLKLGKLAKLKELDEIIAVGHPSDRPWQLSSGKITTVESLRLQYSGDAVYPGNSGGALLNSKKFLIGIVTQKTPESGSAIRIDVAMDKLVEWNIPVHFKLGKSRKLWPYLVGGTALITGAIAAAAIIIDNGGIQEITARPVGRPNGN